MSKASRDKGARGENEVCAIYREYGWPARRNWQSGGQGGGDLVGGPPGTSTEVKFEKELRIWSWLAQCERQASATDIPLLAHRTNARPWYGIIPKDDYNELHLRIGRIPNECTRPNARYAQYRSIRFWKLIDECIRDDPQRPLLHFRRGEWGEAVTDTKKADTADSRWYSALPLEDLCDLLKRGES